MEALFLLTGPNGGGKSSLLRSVCAAALLANCGLMVPAARAEVPSFDSIVLRMMSADSPADSKSSFQMEMWELRSIVEECGSRSLVLVDELCKGTEPHKGACLVGATVEDLCRKGCRGIVSTHFHSVLNMPLEVGSGLRRKKMSVGTHPLDGRMQPTWRLEDGECRESLAFEVALDQGVPQSIVDRASQLLVQSQGTSSQASANQLQSQGPSSQASANQLKSQGPFFHGSGTVSQVAEGGVSGTNGRAVSVTGSNGNALTVTETNGSAVTIRDTATAADNVTPGQIFGSDLLEELRRLKDFNSLPRGLHSTLALFVGHAHKLMGMHAPWDEPRQRTEGDAMRGQGVSKAGIEGDSMRGGGPVCHIVLPKHRPALNASANTSCVYILQRYTDMKFYVGETDNIEKRIEAHRSKDATKNSTVVFIPVRDKSEARRIETGVIRALYLEGVSLANAGDQNHKSFGGASKQ